MKLKVHVPQLIIIIFCYIERIFAYLTVSCFFLSCFFPRWLIYVCTILADTRCKCIRLTSWRSHTQRRMYWFVIFALLYISSMSCYFVYKMRWTPHGWLCRVLWTSILKSMLKCSLVSSCSPSLTFYLAKDIPASILKCCLLNICPS